jgi:hypothetical protein
MKLATKKDIEAPISKVWEVMSDFDGWERAVMRRGVDLSRTDTRQNPGVGMTWLAKFRYRSKDRKVEVKLTEMAAPGVLCFTTTSAAVSIDSKVELIEMSAKRTRMHLVVEIKPRSLGARLFLQSLRLVRGKVERNFDAKAAQFATEVEQRTRAIART